MRLILAFLLFATTANAQSYSEPERGSELRADLLDAIRPHMEWQFGAPVEFVVWDLRVSGDAAFASLMAQRPGGEEINLAETYGAERGNYDPEVGDGATVQALLQRSGRTWVAVHYGISSTDAWWYYEGFCPIWADVIPDVCD